MAAYVASDLAATRGVADERGASQIEGFDYSREVVGIAVHVVVGRSLAGAAMAPAIERDAAVRISAVRRAQCWAVHWRDKTRHAPLNAKGATAGANGRGRVPREHAHQRGPAWPAKKMISKNRAPICGLLLRSEAESPLLGAGMPRFRNPRPSSKIESGRSLAPG
jgi:hypothetical protein